MSRETFRRQIEKYLISQILLVAPCLFVIWRGAQKNQIIPQAVGLLAMIILQAFFSRRNKQTSLFRARLADIYPTLPPLRNFWLHAYAMVPLSWLALVAFLWMKNGQQRYGRYSRPHFIFRHPGLIYFCMFTIAFSPIALGIANIFSGKHNSFLKPVSYWLASPSIYYFTSMTQEMNTILRSKEKFPVDRVGGASPFLKEISENKNLSITGLVIVAAIITKNKDKDVQQRTTASVSVSMSDSADSASASDSASTPDLTKILSQLENFALLIEQHDKSQLQIFQFHPFSFLTSPFAIEAGFLSAINLFMEIKFRQTFFPAVEKIMNELSAYLQKDFPPGAQALLEQLSAVRTRFQVMPSYQAHQAFAATPIGRLVLNFDALPIQNQ